MELIDHQRQSLPNRTIHCQPVQNRHDMMDVLKKCIFFSRWYDDALSKHLILVGRSMAKCDHSKIWEPCLGI